MGKAELVTFWIGKAIVSFIMHTYKKTSLTKNDFQVYHDKSMGYIYFSRVGLVEKLVESHIFDNHFISDKNDTCHRWIKESDKCGKLDFKIPNYSLSSSVKILLEDID